MSKLGIGTVQFGLDYGISNNSGRVLPEDVSSILDYSEEKGILTIDTASTYGKSEEALGLCKNIGSFEIVTKTPLLKDRDEKSVEDYIRTSFSDSLRKLNVSKTETLMIHHASEILSEDGSELVKTLKSIKSEGLCNKIGFSCYSESELKECSDLFFPDVVQVPINIFDQRLLESTSLKKLKSSGVEIHARSIFLQGLVFLDNDSIDPYFCFARSHLGLFHKTIKQKNITPLKASLHFALQCETIDKIIVGVCSKAQIEELYNASQGVVEEMDWKLFSYKDERLLNPSLWKLIYR